MKSLVYQRLNDKIVSMSERPPQTARPLYLFKFNMKRFDIAGLKKAYEQG
ncbi:hypothetical protein HYW60_00060 [Candidatus Kaiserbacteria bacterium]|nr:hypothetical protein [Candidatus Kaiserbacteria bacterium]